MRNRITFDYSRNDGTVPIGSGNALFEIKWGRADGNCIHVYKDPASIDAIALAAGAQEIGDIKDAGRFDYSSRYQTVYEGQILLLRNIQRIYAAVKVRDVKAVNHGVGVDEVTFDYCIIEDWTRDFFRN